MNFTDHFKYDPSSPSYLTRGGKQAGTRIHAGYNVTLDYQVYPASQIVWALHHGNMPVGTVLGFKDKDPFNLNISNLFIQSNSRKTRYAAPRANKTGFRGVSKKGSRFVATVKHNGKSTYLGTYDTPEDASIAYLSAIKIIRTNTI